MEYKMTKTGILSVLLSLSSIVSAQTGKVNAYFTTKQMPNMLKFLPAPLEFASQFFMLLKSVEE